MESIDRDLGARVTRAESQQLAELDRVDQLEERLTEASAHAAQQLKLQNAKVISTQLAELERVDNLELELRNVHAGAAIQRDKIRALEESLEQVQQQVQELCAASSSGSPRVAPHVTKSYYAVHVGRKPGVYNSCEEALLQVDGFADNRHKKFSDYMSAAEYVKTGAESSKYDFYGVRKGRDTGVYTSSEAARIQVEGYSNSEWKGFKEMHQARDYVNYTDAASRPDGALTGEMCQQAWREALSTLDLGELLEGSGTWASSLLAAARNADVETNLRVIKRVVCYASAAMESQVIRDPDPNLGDVPREIFVTLFDPAVGFNMKPNLARRAAIAMWDRSQFRIGCSGAWGRTHWVIRDAVREALGGA